MTMFKCTMTIEDDTKESPLSAPSIPKVSQIKPEETSHSTLHDFYSSDADETEMKMEFETSISELETVDTHSNTSTPRNQSSRGQSSQLLVDNTQPWHNPGKQFELKKKQAIKHVKVVVKALTRTHLSQTTSLLVTLKTTLSLIQRQIGCRIRRKMATTMLTTVVYTGVMITFSQTR